MSGEGLRIDRAEALRYLGYAGQELDADLERRFGEAVAACELGLKPRCVHRAYPVDPARSGDDRVVLAGCGLVLEGRDIVRQLNGACEAVLMACTLGAESERELQRRMALSPADALLYGAAASALVEAAADAEEATIGKEAAERGLQVSFRFSPGYGDLPLSVQPAFLAALDATRRIGLAVTDSNLLIPEKSITAVVGLFEGAPPASSVRPSCATCALAGRCAFKLQGRTCHG